MSPWCWPWSWSSRAVSLTVVFLVFGVLTLLTLIMLCMAPVFILALLFRELDRFFRGFVDVMVTLLISLLAVDIVLGFFETVMLQLENSVHPGGQSYTDAMSMVGQAIVLGIMGYSIKYLTRLIERIGGGVSIALDQWATRCAAVSCNRGRDADRRQVRRLLGDNRMFNNRRLARV